MTLPNPKLLFNAAGRSSISLSDLIERTSDIRSPTAKKISSIQRITGLLRMLSLNAMIESARAGELGRGFSVVASEVREITNSAGILAEELQQELATKIAKLSDHTQSMANAAIG